MVLVGDAVEQWLRYRFTTGGIGGRTRTLYESRLSVFVEMHGERPVSTLTRNDITAWQAKIGRHSPATRRLYLSTVHQFLAWCTEEGMVKEDPTKTLPRVREPLRAPRARTHAEIEAIYRACLNQRDRVIVCLMVQMGLRACEVARLQVADWDVSGATMLIRGKGGHERVLPVPEHAAEELTAYRGDRWTAGPLVTDLKSGRRGLTPPSVSYLVGQIMRRAGVKHHTGDGVTPHTLRHTAASDVLDRCGNVRTVQQMLGHRSLATTQIYLRRAGLDQLRDAMEGRDYSTAC